MLYTLRENNETAKSTGKRRAITSKQVFVISGDFYCIEVYFLYQREIFCFSGRSGGDPWYRESPDQIGRVGIHGMFFLSTLFINSIVFKDLTRYQKHPRERKNMKLLI